MKIRIRDATAADLPIIIEIYRESVLTGVSSYELDPPSDEEMVSRFAAITGQNYPYIIAEDGEGKVLGYAYASPFRTRPAYRYLAEDSVYVAPDARGMGVGSTLLDALMSATADLGIRQMIAVIGVPAQLPSRCMRRPASSMSGDCRRAGSSSGNGSIRC